MHHSDLGTMLSRIEADNTVTETEIIEMRRYVFGDNNVSVVEADALFRINDRCQNKPAEWSDFFVSAMTDFLIRQSMPPGYIDEANATWLIQRISHDGVVETHTEMALLMNVLKKAENVTERLEVFALEQVKEAVLNGTGILARGAELKPGAIGEAEVDILRTILYACGGDGGSWITRAEAELIFDLSDATQSADNHATWKDLFVGTIANHLMMLGSTEKTDIDTAMQRQKWLESDSGISWNLGAAFKAWRAQKDAPAMTYSVLNTAGLSASERVTETEASWLIDRLNRDGQLSSNEQALLQFLRDDCPSIHESLKPLIRSAA